MTSREVDRTHDGTRDAFYTYQIDSLVEERHDSNDDGKVDLVVKYESRVRVALEEDRDRDDQVRAVLIPERSGRLGVQRLSGEEC